MDSLYLSQNKKKAQNNKTAIVFADEATFRQDSTLHTTWARVGSQPKIPVTGQRKSVKIFGCIEIYSARFLYHRSTVFNAQTYLEFLEKIAKRYHGRKIIYIQDNASYHKNGDVWYWFQDNRKWIEVFNLPPYSPEFNATEPLWKYTRKKGTHNRHFESEQAIVESLTKVFKGIQRSPDRIRGYLQPFI